MVTSFVPNPRSTIGGAVVMAGQLRILLERHETVLATLAGADATDDRALDAWRSEGIEVHAVERPVGGGVHGLRRRARLARRWLGSRDPLRALAFRLPAFQETLDAVARVGGFDLIQVEDTAMAAYRYPPGVPAVLTDHEVRDPRRDRGTRPGARLARALGGGRWSRFQAGAWRRFDRIQVFTREDAASLRRQAPDLADRVWVNPFGIDLPPLPGPDPPAGEGVVFVAGFRHPPNVDAAIWLAREIVPSLRPLAPGVRVTIVGADPPRKVRALASRDITITGRVPDVSTHVRTAGVVVAPLRQGGGMRLKVLEAMAAGRAVVATPIAAEGLDLESWISSEKTPPLVVAGDAVGIARETARLLADPRRRSTLGKSARQFVAERHSWEAYGRRLEAAYEEISAAVSRTPRTRPTDAP